MSFVRCFGMIVGRLYLGIPTYNLSDGSKIVQRMLILLSRSLG